MQLSTWKPSAALAAVLPRRYEVGREIMPGYRPFLLPDAFLREFVGLQPDWGPVGYATYLRTYSRLMDDLYPVELLAQGKRLGGVSGSAGSAFSEETEEYWLTCARVVGGVFGIQRWHAERNRLPWSDDLATKHALRMFRFVWDMLFTPPGRGLWMMGTNFVAETGGAALNNCAFTSTEDIGRSPADFVKPFAFLMDMSMLGVGVGFDNEGRKAGLILRTPRVEKGEVYRVRDDREGWVELAGRLFHAFVNPDETLPEHVDYSALRPAGARLRRFGGVSEGPEPLMRLYEEIKTLLLRFAETREPVSAEAITDAMNIEGKCVAAGNVRRSAEIAFSGEEDEVFAALKDPGESNALRGVLQALVVDALGEFDWRKGAGEADMDYGLRMLARRKAEVRLQKEDPEVRKAYEALQALPLNKYRWASNNSQFARMGMDYHPVAERNKRNGEPGLYWLELARAFGRMKDPANFRDRLAKGANPCTEQTLWDKELCTLVETYPWRCANYEQFRRTVKYAYMYAKTVTLVPTHNEETNAVMTRNRRIGTSVSGVLQAFEKYGRRTILSWFDQAYAYTDVLDETYSGWFGVARSIKRTSVKPSGTVSLLNGSWPGVHAAKFRFGYRTMRAGKNDRIVQPLRDAGYRVEPDFYDDTEQRVVIYFPVEEPEAKRTSADLSIWEQMANLAALQEVWADNMVSCTVEFSPNEADQLVPVLEAYEGKIKAVSFLPRDDHGYLQAPYIKCSEAEYRAAVAQLRPVDWSRARGHDVTDAYCDGDKCLIPGRG